MGEAFLEFSKPLLRFIILSFDLNLSKTLLFYFSNGLKPFYFIKKNIYIFLSEQKPVPWSRMHQEQCNFIQSGGQRGPWRGQIPMVFSHLPENTRVKVALLLFQLLYIFAKISHFTRVFNVNFKNHNNFLEKFILKKSQCLKFTFVPSITERLQFIICFMSVLTKVK